MLVNYTETFSDLLLILPPKLLLPSSRCRILFRAGRRELWQFGLLVRQGVPYRESGVSSHRGVIGVVARFQEQDVADGEEVEDDVDLQ